jgi:hypothetical protein
LDERLEVYESFVEIGIGKFFYGVGECLVTLLDGDVFDVGGFAVNSGLNELGAGVSVEELGFGIADSGKVGIVSKEGIKKSCEITDVFVSISEGPIRVIFQLFFIVSCEHLFYVVARGLRGILFSSDEVVVAIEGSVAVIQCFDDGRGSALFCFHNFVDFFSSF